jgi:hypothetical protein
MTSIACLSGLSTDRAANASGRKSGAARAIEALVQRFPWGHDDCFGSGSMITKLLAAICRMDDRGYLYTEYLTVLITVGIVSAAAMLALLPTTYDTKFDSVSILLSIKP